jgi:NAD(P)-dependent dehydrogenase (short-subunit alcohol dehydrogenase family)
MDIDDSALQRQTVRLEQFNSNFIAFTGDVTRRADRAEAIRRASDPNGGLHVLVNNAAVFLLAGMDATSDQWERTLAVNLMGPAYLTAEAVEALAKVRGAVVNIASVSGYIAQPNQWTYNAAKGGILELSRCQALDLARMGIRVNSVSPGWIWTEASDRASGGDRAQWEPIWGAYCPLNRCGEPREVAHAICFLLSHEASFITGADLAVDGGYLAMGPERVGERKA